MPAPRPSNLSRELTRFVGRGADLRALAAKFAAGARVVTLVGPGGVGKTRLAARFAQRWLAARRVRRTVAFVPLADLASEGQLVAAIGAALEIDLGAARTAADAREQLEHALAARGEVLLVLDAFESLTHTAAATVGRFRERAPDVRVLATSREPLGLAGEACQPLGPLATRDAVALFLDRASTARPGFARARADDPTVARIVEHVDRMPLAIELAAARVAVLSPAQLLERLPRRPAPGDDATAPRAPFEAMTAAVAWAWRQLADDDRAAALQCTVFRGGFDIEAAEAVLHVAGRGVLDAIDTLRRRALLACHEPPGAGGAVRFELYNGVREYLLAGPARAPDAAVAGALAGARVRHAEHFIALAGRLGGDHAGRLETHRALAAEADNVLAAHAHALADDPASLRALRAAVAFDLLRAARGPQSERLDALDAALASAPPDAPASLLARAHLARGRALRELGRMDEARDACARAEALASACGDADMLARAINAQAVLHWNRGEIAPARAFYARLAEHARARGDRHFEGSALLGFGSLAALEGDAAAARDLLLRALPPLRAAGVTLLECAAVGSLGDLAHDAGLLDEARAYAEQALALARELGHRQFQARYLAQLAVVLRDEGRADEAAAAGALAVQTAREAGAALTAGLAALALGTALDDAGRGLDAQRHYDAALDAFRRVGNRACQALAAALLGRRDAWDARAGSAATRFAWAEEALAGHPAASPVRDAVALHRGHLALAQARAHDAAGQRSLADSLRAEVRALADDARARAVAARSLDVRYALRSLDHALATPRGASAATSPARGAAAAAAAPQPPVLRVGRDAAWIEPAGGARVDLTRRRPVRLVLLALLAQQRARPGAGVRWTDLLAAGWPGERMRQDAAYNRVRTAVWTLRRLGLGAWLCTQHDGYLLDRGVQVVDVAEAGAD